MRLFILHGYVAGVRGIRARAVAILSLASVATIGLALVGFREESALRNEPMPFVEMLYSAFGLFAFAGNRFGFPKTDLLVAAYFFAPFLTASALFEAAMRIAEARKPLLLVGLRGHTLVCGAGKLGMLLARYWDARRVPTALVDVSAPELAKEAPYLVVLGDMTREATLRAARASNAGRIFLTAGDDLINLEVATRLLLPLRGIRVISIARLKHTSGTCRLVETPPGVTLRSTLDDGRRARRYGGRRQRQTFQNAHSGDAPRCGAQTTCRLLRIGPPSRRQPPSGSNPGGNWITVATSGGAGLTMQPESMIDARNTAITPNDPPLLT